jgi:peptidoglycan hydrolase CwlO-like protein
MVCSEERYFKASALQDILAKDPSLQEAQEEIKKLHKQVKWLQTRHKTIFQENKSLQAQIDLLQLQKEEAENKVARLTPHLGELRQIQALRRQKRLWQISSAALMLSSLLLALLHWRPF